MDKKIYLDNAATTMMNSEVLAEMMPYFSGVYGNASSLHSFGRDAKFAVDTARERIANGIGCKPEEIYFTSGATEANNWILRGVASANRQKGNHIITTKIEHPSILQTCAELEKQGYRVTYLDVDEKGLVRIDQLIHFICDETILISIMTANNEVGTIQNIQAIANIANEKGVPFHTDATQALGAVNLNVGEMKIDALSISAHKIYGPKGVGALYIKNGLRVDKFMTGGSQESDRRAGTLNTPAIVGFGKAVEIATRDIIANCNKVKKLRDYFVAEVQKNIDMVYLNGHPVQRLPNNASLSFAMVDSESIMFMLDLKGIAVSTGSACSSGVVQESHVLKAMGLPDDLVKSTVRFSLSKSTTKEEIDEVVQALIPIVKKLRHASPVTKAQVGKLKKGDK